MQISGFATPEGTLRFQHRFEGQPNETLPIAPGYFRETPQHLNLSSLGMGTYLGALDEADSQTMSQAAIRSVSSGAMNVLDCAINYRYQLSERALATALQALLAQGFQRDGLFLCSKNGFISPDATRQQQGEDFRKWFHHQYLASGRIQPDDIAAGMHCMAPGYLDDQLNQSLRNLNVQTLDLMYLHNAAESQLPEVGRERFMERLHQAFTFYETARQDGRIRYYGLATWDCFRVNAQEQPQSHLHLETVVQLAETIGGSQHGFRFIQLPFNLAFSEAATQPTQTLQGQPVTLLEAAQALDIGVFTSVPLLQGQLLQDPHLPHFPGLTTPAQICLQFARSQPGIIAPLVGHKQAAHVEQNLKVATLPPLQTAELEAAFASV